MAGWVLGQAGLKTTTRKGLAALILGANMPDIDVFFGNAPWDPLAIHRGFTHGLLGGVVVMPPILAGLLWLLDRWQLSHDKQFESGLPMRFGWLVLLCYLGAATHPLLDMLTTYSVQLLSPFSNLWFHADGLFIIDIWLWLLLAIGIGVSKRREQHGKEWRRLPQAVIGIVLAYIAINLVITEQANAAVRDWAGDRQARSIFASPPPVTFWRRGLARGRLLPPQPIRSARGRLRRSLGMPAGEHGRPDRARGNPPRSQPAEVPQMVDPSAGGGRARRLLGPDRNRRCALRPGTPVAARAGDGHRDRRTEMPPNLDNYVSSS